MIKQFAILLLGLLIGYVAGWYLKSCQVTQCPPVVQVQPQTVTTEVAKPALDAQQRYADREKQLTATIDDLRAKAAAKPRTVTVTKEVPVECKQYVPAQPPQCLDPDDLDILRAAQRATTGD